MQRSVDLSVYSLDFTFIWNSFGILKGPLQPKKLFSQYLEFWINQLRKNTDVYCIHTVCNMVQGISREKTVHLPSCVTAIIREKFNSLDFPGFKYSQT